jgi:1-acyl-sn-glycerol-3-phosphate acyltransferase
MRTILVFLTLLIMTPVLCLMVIIGALFGAEDREGSIYDKAPRWWAALVLRVAGVRVRLHNVERMQTGEPRIFVSNHVSWFDVWVLAAALPRYKFVGKAELFRIPIFGRAARTAGMIAIERENRKAAFESYRLAAKRIHAGASVVVFPEGTRGRSYALRPFKKGPFVLAVAAGVPIVPTIVHGTLRPGIVDIHFLEPIDAEGLTYEDRNRLSRAAWGEMAAAMRELYGVESTEPVTQAREVAAAD